MSKTSSSRSIDILFEDEDCIVFDKPAGLLTIATAKNEQRTLVNLVNEQYAGETSSKLYPCHRLDRETSGAIIFAKGKRRQQMMRELFFKQAIKKLYIAFVHGRLKRQSGQMSKAVTSFDQRKFQRNAKPKPALTKYKVTEFKKHFSVVEVEPITGRTNQIRIHFKQIGHPLVGERKYAFAKDYALKFRRSALHCFMLQWQHPVTKKDICIKAPLAQDMREFLNKT